MSLEDVAQSAEEWARENLDEDVLRLLEEVDRDRVTQFFSDVQKRLGGENVADLAPLNASARAILPLLDRYVETEPYAAWLRARLDYLEMAEEVRRVTPPPKPQPGQPLPPIPNPAPKLEREMWATRLADRPWPKAASTSRSITTCPSLSPL